MKSLLLILVSCFVVSVQAKVPMRVETKSGKIKLLLDVKMTSSLPTDILFVVDNSGSMSSHQQNLANHMPVLVNELTNSNLDYQAAVITTDSGVLKGTPDVISASTPDAATLLSRNVMVGTDGGPTEAIFDPIVSLLSGFQKGMFVRNDARLEMIFVTDAEDQSQKMTPAKFFAFLGNVKKVDLSDVSAHGLIVPSSAPSDCSRDYSEKPVKLEYVISELGGLALSLCDQNYSSNIQTLAQKIVKNASGNGKLRPINKLDRIELPSLPEISTISVNYGSQVLIKDDSSGWSFDANTNEIVFGSTIEWTAQPEGTPVEITYVPVAWNK